MAIYDNFPWTSIHELNLSWIIEQVKAGNIKIDEFTEALEQFAEDYDTLSALAAAFTIAGSNITTTKNFSAASLSGPLTGNVTGNLTGNVTGDVTGTASAATEALNAIRLKTYHVPYTEDLNRALTGGSLNSRIWSVHDPMLNKPSDVSNLEKGTVFVLGTGQLKTVNGKSCAVEVQYLWPSVTQKWYYRYVYEDTDTFTLEDADSWVEMVTSVDHATTADSATTATTATSATTATTATSATTATTATNANNAYRMTVAPKIGYSDLNYVTTPTNTIAFEYCSSSASNLPTSFGGGALVLVIKRNSNGNTYISQWAFNPDYMSGGGDGNGLAMRYGYCTGEDKDPQDDTFTWSTWKYMVGTSA